VDASGSIVQVNISRGGLPKRPIDGGMIAPLGIEGDLQNHPEIHGGPLQAILIISAEVVDDLIARGYPLFYGAMGENLTTRGIDYRTLRVGDQLRVGGAILEITKPRGPCKALDIYGESLRLDVYDALVKQRNPESPRWGMSGLYASVVRPGPVRAGDPIELLSALA
jgi:MOSC domain-containing protein YiiM